MIFQNVNKTVQFEKHIKIKIAITHEPCNCVNTKGAR